LKFTCPLIAVSNLKTSKKFYEDVLGQKIIQDLGWNVAFAGGFAIQFNFADIVSVDKDSFMNISHNFELYFEEEDFKKKQNVVFKAPPSSYTILTRRPLKKLNFSQKASLPFADIKVM